MKKGFTKAVTLTVATTMLIGTIPFTAIGVLAGESKYPAIATYNEISEIQTNIYDELEKVAQQDSVLQEKTQPEVQNLEGVIPQALELDTTNAEKSGKWGTCTWSIDDDGVLTISGGIASGSVKKTSTNTAGYRWVSPWASYMYSIKKVVIEDKITFENNTSLANLFDTFILLEEIDGFDKLDTSNVNNMSYMFYQCTALTSVNVSQLDTSNVTDMSSMFRHCCSLTSIDVSKFDTSNVISMYGMFKDCIELTSIDVSKFDTSNVTEMDYMFSSCGSLATLDVSSFDTSNVTKMGSMFSSCSSLTSIDVSKFNTSKVTDMYSMFNGCSSLTSIDISQFDTSKVTSMYGMFCECSSLTSIDLGQFDTSKVTSMYGMFWECSSLTSIDVSQFNTSNVISMSYMFCGCSSLVSIDVSKFDTSNVADMTYMFGRCSSLTSIDVSNFDTSSVKSMVKMFDGCNSLTRLDLSKFNLNENVLKGDGKAFQDGLLPTTSTCLKQVIMPSDFGTEDNIKIILDDMYTIAPSWTDKTANKVYASKPDTLIAGHSYVVTGSEYDKEELSIKATKTENGNEITFTANGNGGSGKYTYKFIVYNKTTNSWAKLQDFSEKNTFTWTKGNAGDRYFYVDVKDNTTGKTVRSEALNVKIEETEKPLAISATKKEADKTVTFTAEGSGGSGKYSYKFIVYNKTTNSWAKLQDFSSKNTFTWTKGNAGDRYFYVDVKDNSTGKVVRSEALNVKLGNTTSKPTSTLTASTSNVNVGGKVTLTAKATAGSGKYTYKFLIYNPTTKQWAKLQDFSDKSTFTWTAGSAGARQFYVDVKDSNGNVTRSKVVNVGVGNAQSVTKLSVKATASTTANKVGQNVTFTATGNGGAGGYTYKFLVYNKTTNQWAKLQDFSATSKLTWTAGSAGEREFYIDVKDKNGNTVRSSVMNVKTTK